MKVKVDTSNAIKGLKSVKDLGKTVEAIVAPQAAAYFQSITPIDTGNARANTHFESPNKIDADYPYAQRLDHGYSKQAPSGMSAPTEAFVKKILSTAVKQALKKLGK